MEKKEAEGCRFCEAGKNTETQERREPNKQMLELVNTKTKRGYLDADISVFDLKPWPNLVRVDRGRRSFFLCKDNTEDIALVQDESKVLSNLDLGRLAGCLTPLDWACGAAAKPGVLLVNIAWCRPKQDNHVFDEVVDFSLVTAEQFGRRVTELEKLWGKVIIEAEIMPHCYASNGTVCLVTRKNIPVYVESVDKTKICGKLRTDIVAKNGIFKGDNCEGFHFIGNDFDDWKALALLLQKDSLKDADLSIEPDVLECKVVAS